MYHDDFSGSVSSSSSDAAIDAAFTSQQSQQRPGSATSLNKMRRPESASRTVPVPSNSRPSAPNPEEEDVSAGIFEDSGRNQKSSCSKKKKKKLASVSCEGPSVAVKTLTKDGGDLRRFTDDKSSAAKKSEENVVSSTTIRLNQQEESIMEGVATPKESSSRFSSAPSSAHSSRGSARHEAPTMEEDHEQEQEGTHHQAVPLLCSPIPNTALQNQSSNPVTPRQNQASNSDTPRQNQASNSDTPRQHQASKPVTPRQNQTSCNPVTVSGMLHDTSSDHTSTSSSDVELQDVATVQRTRIAAPQKVVAAPIALEKRPPTSPRVTLNSSDHRIEENDVAPYTTKKISNQHAKTTPSKQVVTAIKNSQKPAAFTASSEKVEIQQLREEAQEVAATNKDPEMCYVARCSRLRIHNRALEPDNRERHTAVNFNEQIFVFGGVTMRNPCCTSTVFNGKAFHWRRITTGGDEPYPSVGHSAVCYGPSMVVIGGIKDPDRDHGVAVLNIATLQWTVVPSEYSMCTESWQDSEDSGRNPNDTAYHSAVVHRQDVYVFGGVKAGLPTNQLDVLDLSTLRWHSTAEFKGHMKAPSPRQGHSAVVVGSNGMIIFGGRDALGVSLGDCHQYSFDRRVFETLATSGTPPSPRFGHSAAVVDDRMMLLFGGSTLDGTISSELFLFENLMWTEVKLLGDAIPGRKFSSLFALQPIGDGSIATLGFFGGVGPSDINRSISASNATYILSLSLQTVQDLTKYNDMVAAYGRLEASKVRSPSPLQPYMTTRELLEGSSQVRSSDEQQQQPVLHRPWSAKESRTFFPHQRCHNWQMCSAFPEAPPLPRPSSAGLRATLNLRQQEELGKRLTVTTTTRQVEKLRSKFMLHLPTNQRSKQKVDEHVLVQRLHHAYSLKQHQLQENLQKKYAPLPETRQVNPEVRLTLDKRVAVRLSDKGVRNAAEKLQNLHRKYDFVAPKGKEVSHRESGEIFHRLYKKNGEEHGKVLQAARDRYLSDNNVPRKAMEKEMKK